MGDRAGVWLRVSTGQQDEASQEPDLERWVRQRDYEVKRTYRVHGLSAYHGRQEPDLRQAMADMKVGDIQVLCCWKSDRLERRGAYELMGLVREARSYGGRIEFVTEPVLNVPQGPIGDMMLAFYGAMSHHESEVKRDRTLAKQASLRASGSLAAGRVPYGLKVEQRNGLKVLVPDGEKADEVRAIFRLIAQGSTLIQAARAASKSKTWPENSVRQVVNNPVYRGLVQHGGVTYTAAEPLVSSADWLQANQVLAARGRKKGRGGGRPSGVLLRPVCGQCGGPMYLNRASYRCHGVGPSGTTAQRRGCGTIIRVEALEAEVLAEFESADDAEVIETIVPGKDYAEELAQAQLALRDLDPMADGYDERHDALMTELRRLRELPAEPERRTSVATGRTEGEAFSVMSRAEQRAFIRQWVLTIWPEDSDDPRALAAALMGRRWSLNREK